MHPPPSSARANFTLLTECTPEISGCYSVYSVSTTAADKLAFKSIIGVHMMKILTCAKARNIEKFVSKLLFSSICPPWAVGATSKTITLSIRQYTRSCTGRVCTSRGEQEKLLNWVAYILGYLMKVDLPDSPVPRNIGNEKNNQCCVLITSLRTKGYYQVCFCSSGKQYRVLVPWS